LYHEFARAIAGADQDVDLFGGAIAIARLGGNEIDLHRLARELDLIAEDVRDQAGEFNSPDALSHAIDHELFAVRGFHGNAQEYLDPRNSYLDQVIERRTGLPITLSLVYMEVAQRVGLQCDGVGYPGHFIVRCGDPDHPIFVDPYQQGARLDAAELLAQLRGLNLGGARPESFLAAVTRRQILQRMLNNLHGIFREARDMDRWLATVELLLRIEPWNATLVGERGMLYYRQGQPERALADLERYVGAAAPGAVSSGARRLLDELRLRQERGSEDLA
jgi:regulator of sirC expression with transglutaminase-like and TPR domain